MTSLLTWLIDHILGPFCDWIKAAWDWVLSLLALLLQPFVVLFQWIDSGIVAMTNKINSIVVPDLGAFSVAADLLAKANHWFPVAETFLALAAWLALWVVCTSIRFVKNFLLENGW